MARGKTPAPYTLIGLSSHPWQKLAWSKIPIDRNQKFAMSSLGASANFEGICLHGYGILLSSTLASGSRHTDYRITNFELDYVFSTALINSNFYPSMATDQRQGLSWGNISISRSLGTVI